MHIAQEFNLLYPQHVVTCTRPLLHATLKVRCGMGTRLIHAKWLEVCQVLLPVREWGLWTILFIGWIMEDFGQVTNIDDMIVINGYRVTYAHIATWSTKHVWSHAHVSRLCASLSHFFSLTMCRWTLILTS